MSHQVPLTLITPVRKGQWSKLIEITDRLRNGQLKGVTLPFEQLGTIHYFRIVLLEEIKNETTGNIPQRLVVCSNHDGDDDEHLAQLSENCSLFIDELFENCEGYPLDRTTQSRVNYLKQWKTKPIAAFAGAKETTLKTIRQESALRKFLWDHIRNNKWDGRSAKDIHRELQNKVLNDNSFKWVENKNKIPRIPWVPLILVLLILLPFILLLAVFVVFWVLYIHFFHEKKDVPLGLKPSQISEAHVQSLELYEDYYHQNQFTQLLFMKPGKARLFTLTAFFGLARLLIKYIFVGYKLMDIPTIHFASWMMLDNNKTMLFFSNFDGSWQQYLGDFIDKSGWGLTGIWSNTEKFPKTTYLFWDGAYDEEHFLAWSRSYQIPTQLWYCAYPNLSIKNINNNTWIRHNIIKDMNEKQSKQFLQRI